jgi:hypothetical protein
MLTLILTTKIIILKKFVVIISWKKIAQKNRGSLFVFNIINFMKNNFTIISCTKHQISKRDILIELELPGYLTGKKSKN